jgi:hypothetical protein
VIAKLVTSTSGQIDTESPTVQRVRQCGGHGQARMVCLLTIGIVCSGDTKYVSVISIGRYTKWFEGHSTVSRAL